MYDVESLAYNKPDISISYFDVCIVSSIYRPGEGHVADLSKPLPDIIALDHNPYDDLSFDEDDNSAKLISSAMAITFFETTCKEQVVGDYGSYAYPLFPGFGKYSGTCPDKGEFVLIIS